MILQKARVPKGGCHTVLSVVITQSMSSRTHQSSWMSSRLGSSLGELDVRQLIARWQCCSVKIVKMAALPFLPSIGSIDRVLVDNYHLAGMGSPSQLWMS